MASNKMEKATALLQGVSSGTADLATKPVSPGGFVQHDPFVADGAAGLRERAGRSGTVARRSSGSWRTARSSWRTA